VYRPQSGAPTKRRPACEPRVPFAAHGKGHLAALGGPSAPGDPQDSVQNEVKRPATGETSVEPRSWHEPAVRPFHEVKGVTRQPHVASLLHPQNDLWTISPEVGGGEHHKNIADAVGPPRQLAPILALPLPNPAA
jgi:hypothetical protein